MEEQRLLFDPNPTAVPPHSAPQTRAAAQVAIRPDAGRLRRKVYEFIRSRGSEGAIDQEVQIALEMTGDSERPRRRELQQEGYIRDAGVVRLTRAGRTAVVWVSTEKAFPQLGNPKDAEVTEA